jgi:hypothetical protein
MKQRMTRRALNCLLLSALGLTTACVDNSYDLTKDIDLTITVGGDLTTPGNSSEEITLDDLFDVDYETSDLDTLDNGDFVLCVNGDPTSSSVKVNDVTVDRSEATKSSKMLTFTSDMLVQGETSTMAIEDLNPEWQLKNNDIPEDVIDLEYADDIQHNDVVLRLETEGNTKGVILKKGLRFTFPSYLQVALTDAFTSQWFALSQVNGQTVMTLKNDYRLSSSGADWKVNINRIYFKSTGNVTVPAGEGFLAATANTKAKVLFNVEIPVDGDVAVKAQDFPAGSSEVNFRLVSHVVSNEMAMGRVRAKVNPDIDFTVSEVTIEDLPDFLTDNDVNADLTNPQVLLRVNNQSEVDVNLQAELHSYKEGNKLQTVVLGTDINTVNSKTIRLKASTENLLCISPLNENVPNGYTWVQVENLPDLIRTIPDLIKVENVEAKVLQQFYTVELGVNKEVHTDYDLNAPLEFGKEFSIVYKDTLDGWSEDIEKYEMKELEVSLSAINRIPLNLDLSAMAIDAQGHVMDDVLVETDGFIAAGTKTEPNTKVLTFTLKKKDGTRIKNLDGLILRLDGKAFRGEDQSQSDTWESQTLNASQTLKLDDLKLRIKGGVTMDLN